MVFFYESFNEEAFRKAVGVHARFVQDNHSRSGKGVIRGMHYQLIHPQDKLVRATVGEIFDVAVDLRRSSPSFGRWYGVKLSAENKLQLWVPRGFAHGFVVLSDITEVQYKTTDFYHAEGERTLAFDDNTVSIKWPAVGSLQLSEKDKLGRNLGDLELFQ